MLMALIDKVDIIKVQMTNVSIEMEIPRKSQKQILEIKNTMTEIECLWWAC